MDKVWMVFCDDNDSYEDHSALILRRSRAPRYCHESIEHAEAEAERLSQANPGLRFVILESVAVVSTLGHMLGDRHIPFYQRAAS